MSEPLTRPTSALLVSFGITAALAAACRAPRDVALDRAHPNVLLLLADDQGWADLGFRGHPRLETPHLDAMAEAGLVLERFYSAAPVCSPTRASCLTGRHPMRMGIPGANAGHLPTGEVTLAELLSARGYRAGFFGKWHLGTLASTEVDSNRGGRPAGEGHFSPPQDHGFDVVFATEAKVPTYDPMVHPTTGEPYGTSYWDERGARVETNLEGDDSRVIVDRVEPFVRASAAAGEPFLAVVWLHAPHLPVVQDPAMRARYADVADAEARAYYGCITALDAQVGRLRALLRELGIAEDTLVWYASDNGPEGAAGKAPGSALPLRGRKRDLFEGGVRVPGIVEWPARVDAGGESAVPCVTSDLLPTIAAAVGIDAPPQLDGMDLGPLLDGEMEARGAPIAFWSGRRAALTGDRWKIVRTNEDAPWRLHDLAADPGEAVDLAGERPDLVAEMSAAFEAWRAEVRADAEDATRPAPVR